MVGPPTYPAPIQQIFMLDLVKASEGADKVIPEAETTQSMKNDRYSVLSENSAEA